MNILRDEGIDFETIPGVTAYSAAAAKMNQELTMPNISQTVILTRTATRASAMPNAETLENFARTGVDSGNSFIDNQFSKSGTRATPLLWRGLARC